MNTKTLFSPPICPRCGCERSGTAHFCNTAPGLILNASQAEAVYSAMCVLNNVSARIDAFFYAEAIHVREIPDGRIVTHRTASGVPGMSVIAPEVHASQSAFATAYGLQQG